MTETAVAVINASAIRHNLEQIKSTAAGCRIMAVIKANAYGHGLIQVARILPDVDALAVARVEEGASLRVAGIGQPILVLEGCADFAEAELAAEHNLDLVVHERSHFEMLDALPGVMTAAGVNHRVEVYPGTEHGFAFPERPAYVKPAAERHWERMLELFGRNLSR